ncbi:hypothetical protein KY389_09790 [Paracoccus bogoriensis]|uniref:hypothetical protein n=1 Tax=Paracoccus bogoriensis TaxID=242065 RepID=UPI001CA4FA1F|nr:hypothetical protein [Paracoccus bogoriensis]MBW7056983.1 hypothetical protein [Paracoccus bogoriensis]
MAFNLKLPVERGKQLQMIAEAEGKTVVDVITDHIRAKVAAGVIPEAIPGIDVAKDGPAISIKAPGFEASVPLNEGPTLADLLKDAASATDDPERKARWIEGLAALSGVKVKRMGAGVKLVSPLTGKEYPLASGVAADLADQIKLAAE